MHIRVPVRRFALALIFVLTFVTPVHAVSQAEREQGLIDCTPAHIAKHNPGLADGGDRILCFQAYISNFNTQPRRIGNRDRFLGVPHWVVHRVGRWEVAEETHGRPSSWFTIPDLAQQKIAPTDDSYHFSRGFVQAHKNWYERGHLAPKYLAERIGESAARFTHNVANAVPQRKQFNAGSWNALECFTGAWANKYGEVWVIAGPVFTNGKPSSWLRSNINRNAMPVAIPQKMFKIVVRKTSDNEWAALGFVYPQTHASYKKSPYDPARWFKSVAEIERLTGATFLSPLPNTRQLKAAEATKLWPVAKADFDQRGCSSDATDVL